jgi:pimeloyl-ACP methyl ester carboxylesterase
MNRPTMSRREVMRQALGWGMGASVGGGLLTGCDRKPLPALQSARYCGDESDPPLSWGPSVLTPVFYGYADYGPSSLGPGSYASSRFSGAPVDMRVYYPSLGGSPHCAPFLTGPGRFPLVLLLHGQCNQNTGHYIDWSSTTLPAVLARSGFIVAIPNLVGMGHPWELQDPTYARIHNVIDWLHTYWSHRAFIMMDPPTLGIIGHSYGALFGAQLALTLPATAYVSLGGAWAEWVGSRPQLIMPKLMAWGSADWDAAPAYYNALFLPKHRLVFQDGEHWDFVPAAGAVCSAPSPPLQGPCGLVDDLAGDFSALFFTKYMPPEAAEGVAGMIPDSLEPTNVALTMEQMFYAGGHLGSFGALASPCHATLSWAPVPPGMAGARSLP